jgi:methylase of polypeptide subunit release factors
MNEQVAAAFEFNGVAIEVWPGVFTPNKTSELILEAALKHNQLSKSALDLGCGSGVVSISLKKLSAIQRMCGSDISERAIANARGNAARIGVEVEFRQGNFFEPWKDERFDSILYDVSGVAEPIARLSPWYPPEIACDAGEDGADNTVKMLEHVQDYLSPNGVLYLPTVSLSNEVRILEVARARFMRVECLLKRSWPFKEDFWKKIISNETCRRLIDQGIVKVFQRGSRYLWDTSIYLCANV